jgi:hypothetical protein
LHRAGIEHAEALAAVTNSDTLNAVVAHGAHSVSRATRGRTQFNPHWRPLHEAFGLQVVSRPHGERSASKKCSTRRKSARCGRVVMGWSISMSLSFPNVSMGACYGGPPQGTLCRGGVHAHRTSYALGSGASA